MENIINFYKNLLCFEEYYDIILYNSSSNTKEYIQCPKLLNGINIQSSKSTSISTKNVELGDFRVDVPVWFGDFKNAKNRIIVFGLEPRDTNPDFNIEKVGNKVFAAPFGIDRWNEFSTVKRKPQNKYFRVFKELIFDSDNFILFSDIVKEYQKISSTNLKGENDLNARKLFFSKAEKERDNLMKEINNINPTHIITLGNDSYSFLSKYYPEITIRVRHPANGGESIAKQMLKEKILTIP